MGNWWATKPNLVSNPPQNFLLYEVFKQLLNHYEAPYYSEF